MAGDAFEHVVFRGKLMDRKTMAFLQAMEEKLGYQLTVVQGCYNPGGVAQSGGTHDGGGVVDLAAYDWERKVKVAADLGAFAYHRVYVPGLWGEHIHLGIRNHGRLSPEAQGQQRDWDSTPPRDGLASHAVWHGYHPGKKIEFQYPVRKEAVVPKPTKVTQARDSLVEAIHSLGDAMAFLDDANPSRVKAKSQLDEIKKARRDLRKILDVLPKR